MLFVVAVPSIVALWFCPLKSNQMRVFRTSGKKTTVCLDNFQVKLSFVNLLLLQVFWVAIGLLSPIIPLTALSHGSTGTKVSHQQVTFCRLHNKYCYRVKFPLHGLIQVPYETCVEITDHATVPPLPWIWLFFLNRLTNGCCYPMVSTILWH